MGESVSAGVIPINSMYDGEEERQAQVPPVKTPEAVIEETKEEEVDHTAEA